MSHVYAGIGICSSRLTAFQMQWCTDSWGGTAVPDEQCSRSGWLHSFLRDVMMLSTPSEGSEALPDMSAATDLDLRTCLYTSTCMQAESLELLSCGWTDSGSLWTSQIRHHRSSSSPICDMPMASAATHACTGGNKTNNVNLVVGMVCADAIVRRTWYL